MENKPPTLIVVNKKDLIKPGEIAKRIQVCYLIFHYLTHYLFIFLWSRDPSIIYLLYNKNGHVK
jgi:hypothetical protein